jgi:ubiquinone/menaquinone biosynthesis C-methylase UbiE
MVEIARNDHPGIDFRVDSCTELSTVGDGEFDLVVANYVLMDASDLEATMGAFARVLKPGGAAVLVFSHPCFPQGSATVSGDGRQVSYHWDFPYFERKKCTDPPWGHFKSEFLRFHRPLSDYWKAFTAAGFAVVGFEEPRVAEDRYHLAESETKLRNSKTCPYSIAFKLRKSSSAGSIT